MPHPAPDPACWRWSDAWRNWPQNSPGVTKELARVRGELGEMQDRELGREQRAKALEVRHRVIDEQLRIATTERDAALREVDRRSAVARELGSQVPNLEAELDDRDRDLDAIERELEDCEREVDDLRRDLSEREMEVAEKEAENNHLRRDLDAAEAQGRRTAGEYGARVRELEQLVSTLVGGLAQTKDDIDRAAGSRAWRWGHGATRGLRRLALRRNVTDGALARALKRIEQIEAAGRVLPEAPSPPAPAAPVSASTEADERSEEERADDRAVLATDIRERLGPAAELESLAAPSRSSYRPEMASITSKGS